MESMAKRVNGAMVATESGRSTTYAVDHLQSRGFFFIEPGAEVYEGMIVGEHNRPNDADVAMTKEKKLTNCRSKTKDENVCLAPAHKLTIDTAIEWIDADELVEVTPDTIRLRKRVLSCSARPGRRADAIKSVQAA
jgi:GTP-binding protein